MKNKEEEIDSTRSSDQTPIRPQNEAKQKLMVSNWHYSSMNLARIYWPLLQTKTGARTKFVSYKRNSNPKTSGQFHPESPTRELHLPRVCFREAFRNIRWVIWSLVLSILDNKGFASS